MLRLPSSSSGHPPDILKRSAPKLFRSEVSHNTAGTVYAFRGTYLDHRNVESFWNKELKRSTFRIPLQKNGQESESDTSLLDRAESDYVW